MKSIIIGITAPIIFISVVASQTPDQEDIRSVARLFAASQYYLKKGEPDKAQRNLASLYMVLKNIQFMRSKEEAEDLFRRVTRVQTGVKDFFVSMEIIDRNGRLIEVSKEPEKKSYTCTREQDGSSYCSEN